MFRLIVYMYDLRHDPARSASHARSHTSSCCPMLASRSFRSSTTRPFADLLRRRSLPYLPAWRGLDGARGRTPTALPPGLLRSLDPHLRSVEPRAFARWALTGFLLYLRVSGQFHLIVGTLHLFGFHLPETHRRYLLASSFTDFWRRINIYWKDFMLKVFFYPVHFRLRRWGATKALVVSTLLVFAATWFFHAYQWFCCGDRSC